MSEDVYRRLADHLSALGMGYPQEEGLEEILRATFSAEEAEIALALPTRVPPLQPVEIDSIAAKVSLPRTRLVEVLEDLVKRGLLFTGRTRQGEKGYASSELVLGWG